MADKTCGEQKWLDELYGKLPLRRKNFSIRLLRILPGAHEQPLRCKLFRTTLIGSPPFQALSYTWGDHTGRKPVTVNDVEVSVTVNLHDALKNIRHECENRTIWADALCINQHDVVERNSQVQETGNIYGFADRVLVWLGGPTEHFKTLAGLRKGQSQGSFDELDSAIVDVLSRPWWHRVWVVQEVCRARKAPVISLGSHGHFDLIEFTQRVQYFAR